MTSEVTQDAFAKDDNGISDADCISALLKEYAGDRRREGFPKTADTLQRGADLLTEASHRLQSHRLTAQSGEGRAAIIEECAAVADGWNPGRKDRVTETGIATAIRELSGDTREGTSALTQRMAETLGARFVISGEGRSGAGEDGPTTAIIAGLWLDILEKDDRTSPEEYPDMALITEEEFSGSIRYAIAALNARQSGEGERENNFTKENDDA